MARKTRKARGNGLVAVRGAPSEPPPEKIAEVEAPAAPPPSDYPIVGIGASAGGLEAFSELLQELPEDPGLAVVLIPHLAPQHESALPTLLGARTRLPVVQAHEGMRVEPNHVYVIPPNVQMGMVDGALHLMPRPTDRSQYTPIDFFLRSLAETAQERAIAVILSGTASDGTVGVREVKANGGFVFAQTPDTAKYDGMPGAAIASGVVDRVLSPQAIAQELVRIARHPLPHVARAVPVASAAGHPETSEDVFQQILALLRTATGVDFARYKRPTIERRMHRRMVLQRMTRVEQYLKQLQESPAEVQALYRDVLIHVTRFFRDPETFEILKSIVFPKVLESRRGDQPVRLWVPGCSTGEEAYSIGIALLELLGDQASVVPIQIFATDVSEPAIDHARAGVYGESIGTDVSGDRLRRFFTRNDGGYRVSKIVRDLCVFARQDITRDPPFSKLDLVVCRNLLIYLGAELQKKVMSVFHYALKPTGFLMLGSAETTGFQSDLFAIAEKKARVYQKKLVASPVTAFPIEHALGARTLVPENRPRQHVPADQTRAVIIEANRLVQDRFAPPGVLVDPEFQIIQFRGQTGAFLEAPPGEPSFGLLKMAREGLLHGLRSALQDARRHATRSGVRVCGSNRTAGGGTSSST